MKKIKVLLSISSLNVGGTERQFLELAKGIDKNLFEVCVCVMYKGTLDGEIDQRSDLRYVVINKKNRYDVLSYYKYCRLIKVYNPDVIYSFLTDLNIISVVCKKLAFSSSRLVWGIRGSKTDLSKYSRIAMVAHNLQKKLASSVDLMICNSNAALSDYRSLGFTFSEHKVIPNGMDSQRFYRNEEIRRAFREKQGLNENDIAIGINSRWDPVKGYEILAVAALRILERYPNVYFFSIGYGMEQIRTDCNRILGDFANTRFIWLGKQLKPETIMPGWDIYCSSSFPGEGFSNAIAEGMLCELAPVVTRSGDSALIVEGVGYVCNPGDSMDLETKLVEMIDNPERRQSGIRSRQQIMEKFSMEQMIKSTQSALLNMINK